MKPHSKESFFFNERDFYAVVREERDKLRAFAQEIMDHWPESGIDGDDLQEIAVKHGLLMPTIRYARCNEEGCFCAGYASEKEFESGVVCFRKTDLLTGGIK